MNLLEMENQFQALIIKLHQVQSDRLKLQIMNDYLNIFNEAENIHIFLSYYKQILPYLLQAINKKSLEFQSPEFLDDIKKHLHIIKDLNITNNPELDQRWGCVDAVINQLKMYLQSSDEKRSEMNPKGPDESKYINALLVERNEKYLPEVAGGVIKELSFDIKESSEDSIKDVIQFRFNCEDQFHKMHNQALNSLIISKNILKKISIEKNRKDFFQLFYSFGDSTHNYEGESLGFGMALLNIANLSKLLPVKYEYILKNDFVITGAIYENGDLLPVSSLSLKEKLKAFFYSPFQKVVIPEMNHIEAEKFLKELSQKYSIKQYNVISFKNIKETLDSEDIFIKKKKYTAIEYLRKNRRLRKYYSSGLLIFLFILIIFFNRDNNPHSCEMFENYLYVKNQAGQRIWKFDLGVNCEQFYHKIDDMDNDGKNEVIINIATNNELMGTVYYYNYNGKMKWKFDNHKKMYFGDDEFSDNYYGRWIFTHDFDNDGNKSIITYFANSPYYPSRLIKFDIEGNILGEYWNSGSFNSVNLLDIDDDGIDEILFSGTNNQYNDGIFGILEHDKIIGHSPQTTYNYTPQNIPEGQQILYMKFNMPDDISGRYGRGHIQNICVMNDSTFSINYTSGILQRGGSVRLDFNNKMALLSYVISDAFLIKYHEIYGKDLRDIHTEAELTNYQFWDGEKWVDEVVFTI
ncbi:MAG: hypothetical protein JXQ65_10175 [Candidatus Marinimicrobia bacterium]|nr:hypothetical protein [Candidatus Neomarinimicrobiota bacterium]